MYIKLCSGENFLNLLFGLIQVTVIETPQVRCLTQQKQSRIQSLQNAQY